MCLDSLLRQSCRDFLAAVIDDASPNQEAVECFAECRDKYSADKRFIFLQNEKNLGASGAINRAIEAVAGDVIMLLDADDTFPPNAVEAVTRCASAKPDRHLYFGDYTVGKEIISCRYLAMNNGGYLDKKKLADDYKLLGTTPFSREIWEKCGRFDEKTRMLNDRDFFLRILEFPEPVGAYIPEVIYHWNIDAGQKSSSCRRYQISLMFLRYFKFFYRNMSKWNFFKNLLIHTIAIPLDWLHLFPFFHRLHAAVFNRASSSA